MAEAPDPESLPVEQVDIRQLSFQNVVDTILKPNKVKVGGIPDDIFVDLTEEEKEKWNCNICYQIANDAHECDNHHLFCHTCCFAWTLTYGENSQRCPVCRNNQPKYIRAREVQEKLGNRRLRCTVEECDKIFPLKIFLMHSHGRERFSNAHVDLETLRPERPPGDVIEVANGRIMIHQMMALLHLEMQLRQQALMSYSQATNQVERIQRLDEVLALNEQLTEVGSILTNMLRVPMNGNRSEQEASPPTVTQPTQESEAPSDDTAVPAPPSRTRIYGNRGLMATMAPSPSSSSSSSESEDDEPEVRTRAIARRDYITRLNEARMRNDNEDAREHLRSEARAQLRNDVRNQLISRLDVPPDAPSTNQPSTQRSLPFGGSSNNLAATEENGRLSMITTVRSPRNATLSDETSTRSSLETVQHSTLNNGDESRRSSLATNDVVAAMRTAAQRGHDRQSRNESHTVAMTSNTSVMTLNSPRRNTESNTPTLPRIVPNTNLVTSQECTEEDEEESATPRSVIPAGSNVLQQAMREVERPAVQNASRDEISVRNVPARNGRRSDNRGSEPNGRRCSTERDAIATRHTPANVSRGASDVTHRRNSTRIVPSLTNRESSIRATNPRMTSANRSPAPLPVTQSDILNSYVAATTSMEATVADGGDMTSQRTTTRRPSPDKKLMKRGSISNRLPAAVTTTTTQSQSSRDRELRARGAIPKRRPSNGSSEEHNIVPRTGELRPRRRSEIRDSLLNLQKPKK